jgi:hypothetical protein
MIPPPAKASTIVKSTQPTAAGQFTAHKIHDAIDDIPIPSENKVRGIYCKID